MIRWLAIALCAQSAAADVMFQDVSDALPQHIYAGGWEHFVGGGVAIFDCNNDTRPDVFVAGGTTPEKVLVNTTQPGGPLTFEAAAYEPMTGVTGAYPLDVDGDGNLDLAVLRVGENHLMRGDGDCGFASVNAAWSFDGGTAWSTAFSATWVDGAPVLAIGNYVDRDDPDGPFGSCDDHTLHRWTGEGFTREVLSPGFCALSILFARDASGTTRLRLSNDRHYYVKGGSEQMYDLTEQRFLGAKDGWPEVSLWGMGIASRDITGDGRAEVMLTSMGDQLMQIAQENGSYAAAPFSIGTYAQRPHVGDEGRPSTGWHAEFADVDNDGRADLFIAKGNVDQMPGLAIEDPNNLLRQRTDGTFEEVSIAAGVATVKRSRGAGLADFDGDGLLDLIVVNRRAPLELYRNISTETGHWLALDLRMTAQNTRAVGAVVRVTAQGRTQVQEVTVGGGHAGGQAGPLHFGLGSAHKAEVEVIWPDGDRSTHTLTADQRHRLQN